MPEMKDLFKEFINSLPPEKLTTRNIDLEYLRTIAQTYEVKLTPELEKSFLSIFRTAKRLSECHFDGEIFDAVIMLLADNLLTSQNVNDAAWRAFWLGVATGEHYKFGLRK